MGMSVYGYRAGRYGVAEMDAGGLRLLVADIDDEGRMTRRAVSGESPAPEAHPRRCSAQPPDAAAAAVHRVARGLQSLADDGAGEVDVLLLPEFQSASFFRSFRLRFQRHTRLPLHCLSPEIVSRLRYLAIAQDRALPPVEGYRFCLQIGSRETDLLKGLGGELTGRYEYPMGAALLARRFFRTDPPRPQMISECEAAIEELLSGIEPAPPGSRLIAHGAMAGALFRLGKAYGLAAGGSGDAGLNAVSITHSHLNGLKDLMIDLPLEFRRRLPGVSPHLAEGVLAAVQITHQLMARLSLPRIIFSEAGAADGWIYRMASQASVQRKP